MGLEVLYVPEEFLDEVVSAIELGIRHSNVSDNTKMALRNWCSEMR